GMDLPERRHSLLSVCRALRGCETRPSRPLRGDRAVFARRTAAHCALEQLVIVTSTARHPGWIVGLGRDVNRDVRRRIAEGVHGVAIILDDLHLLSQQAAVKDDAFVGLAEVLGPAGRDSALRGPGVVVLAGVV